MSLWKDIATGDDGVTFDIISILAIGSIPAAILMQAYAVVFDKHFDCQAFGFGMAAVISAVGLGVRLRNTPPAGTTTTETATATTKTTEVTP